MSFDDVAIRVQGLSKYYQIYEAPKDRLKQMFAPRLQRIIGKQPKQYFREFRALNDVSFEIKKGETVGIIGRNGSGKSTLLQMICGTLTPTNGSIQINGRIAALLELGSGFNPEFTGRENVYMNATVLGLTREEIDTKFDDIITFADIDEFIDLPVKTYSSGMAVRLAFSVVAHINPDILIVDEALAVGDYSFQQKCFKRIDELQIKGCSILLVSHDLSAIVQFCSKGHVFEDGQLVGSGSAAEAASIYKKLSTGTSLEVDRLNSREIESTSRLKDNFPINPAVQDYGDKVAEIYDWGILDEFGNATTVISSESSTEIILRIRFLQSCTNPIVGYFFTDVQGREIVGTNTSFSKSPLSSRSSGECLEVRFKQSLRLTSGEYSLNLGCSEYIDDKLVAHHRLYDVCIFSVFQLHQNVGFYLPETDIEIKELV